MMKNALLPLLIMALVGALSKFVYPYPLSIFIFGLLCLCAGYLYGKRLGYNEGWKKRGKKDEDDSIEITVA